MTRPCTWGNHSIHKTSNIYMCNEYVLCMMSHWSEKKHSDIHTDSSSIDHGLDKWMALQRIVCHLSSDVVPLLIILLIRTCS